MRASACWRALWLPRPFVWMCERRHASVFHAGLFCATLRFLLTRTLHPDHPPRPPLNVCVNNSLVSFGRPLIGSRAFIFSLESPAGVSFRFTPLSISPSRSGLVTISPGAMRRWVSFLRHFLPLLCPFSWQRSPVGLQDHVVLLTYVPLISLIPPLPFFPTWGLNSCLPPFRPCFYPSTICHLSQPLSERAPSTLPWRRMWPLRPPAAPKSRHTLQ